MTYLDDVASAIRAEVPSDVMPEEDDLDQLFRVYALLARTKGQATTVTDVHDAWATWMLGRGEDHESIKPFDHLDRATKREDEPFLRAIHKVASESKRATSRKE